MRGNECTLKITEKTKKITVHDQEKQKSWIEVVLYM